MKVLITGVNGFIGNNLANHLRRNTAVQIEVLSFESSHLEMMKDVKWFYASDPNLNDDTIKLANDGNSFVVSLFFNRQIIGIIGGTLIWPGVMHVWAILSEKIKECRKEFHKKSIDIMNIYFDSLKLWRMQMDVRADYNMGCKWAQSLGFKYEATLKKFGQDGSDYNLYARIV